MLHLLEFNSILTLPSNTEAIAFSIRGGAIGTQDGGSMDFWEDPVYSDFHYTKAWLIDII
jgi:hypothetical protein